MLYGPRLGLRSKGPLQKDPVEPEFLDAFSAKDCHNVAASDKRLNHSGLPAWMRSHRPFWSSSQVHGPGDRTLQWLITVAATRPLDKATGERRLEHTIHVVRAISEGGQLRCEERGAYGDDLEAALKAVSLGYAMDYHDGADATSTDAEELSDSIRREMRKRLGLVPQP